MIFKDFIWNRCRCLLALSLLTAVSFPAWPQLPEFSQKKLRRQAAREYLQPVRPGYEGVNPYWNTYAIKFIYAPAFDFKETEGADYYLFTLKQGKRSWSFKDDKPFHSLAPVWKDIPVGDVRLKVEAVDKRGNILAVVGEKDFKRDYPFAGNYPGPARSYKEAAVKALLYIHYIPAIQHWKTQDAPDMDYELNCYPCKSISGTIRCEMLLAKLVPSMREECMAISRHAADFLLAQSQPDGAPLAFFPPTYYGTGATAGDAVNQGKTMSMEATKVANALLDLYDETGDRKYYDAVIGIMETYKRMQNVDGSFPIKLFYQTGMPVNDVCARLHPILGLLRRIHDQYGIHEYSAMQHAAEKWMDDVAVRNFEMVGQFEDVSVENLAPYQNMTHWTAVPYATYILEKEHVTQKDIDVARQLVDFGEDQFIYWDAEANPVTGIHDILTPCAFEQYFYRVPVDDSAASMATAFLSLYERTGDLLSLAKAKALLDAITRAQYDNEGMIPTAWHMTRLEIMHEQLWISCCYISVNTLLRFAELVEPGSLSFKPTKWF